MFIIIKWNFCLFSDEAFLDSILQEAGLMSPPKSRIGKTSPPKRQVSGKLSTGSAKYGLSPKPARSDTDSWDSWLSTDSEPVGVAYKTSKMYIYTDYCCGLISFFNFNDLKRVNFNKALMYKQI